MILITLLACGTSTAAPDFNIDLYAADKREMLAERVEAGGEAVRITASFTEPATLQDVQDILWPDQLLFTYAYFHDTSGQTITVFTRAPLPELETALVEASDGAEWIGIGAVIAEVSAEEAGLMADDDRIFLVDVSADNHFTGLKRDKGHAPPLAWDLWGL